MHLLIVEDDDETAAYMRKGLTEAGYTVDHANNGRDGLFMATSGSFDAIIMDRMLPGLDGLAVVQAMRAAKIGTPVLILSALGQVDDRVKGLRAGGDDYLTKPFAPDEMAARIEVLLRRRRGGERETQLRIGDLELDLIARVARRGEATLELLPIEFRLLEFLMRNSNQVLTRTMIFESVWGYHFDPGTNVIDVHIARLRRKVDGGAAPSLIQTVRGCGYRMSTGA